MADLSGTKVSSFHFLICLCANIHMSAKVVLVGDTAVGKTAISTRMISDVFMEETLATTNSSCQEFTVCLEEKSFSINLWDTAGQEKYSTMTNLFLRDANIALLIYDISNAESLLRIDEFVKSINNANSGNCLIIFVGNKYDLERDQRQVAFNEGQSLAQKVNASIFIEVSAKTGYGISELKTSMAQLLAENGIRQGPKGVDLCGSERVENSNCC